MRLGALVFISQTKQRGYQIGLSTKAGETQFLSGFVKKSLLLLVFVFLRKAIIGRQTQESIIL